MSGMRRVSCHYRAAAWIVVLLLAWPFVHHALTRHFAMNYWRLGGLAMYAGSGPNTGFALYDESNGQHRLELRTVPARTVGLVRERLRLRHELGLAYPVWRIVQPVLDARPEIGAVGLEERVGRLEGRSGVYRQHVRYTICTREGPCRRTR